MHLSIIILNYKTKGLTKQCVKGVLNADPKLDYEIFVIDNDSGDNCIPELKEKIKDPHLKFIQSEKNIGMGAGNNLGIKQAKGKYILILNPDIAVFKNDLEKMYEYIESHPKVGALGAKLVTPARELQYSCFQFPTPFKLISRRMNLPFTKKIRANYQMANWDHNSTREVDWVQGSCMLVRKDAIGKVGTFDEKFFMYLEDTDWCRRFWQAGYKVIYYPKVSLIHYYSRGAAGFGFLGSLFKKITWIHISSAIKYFWKWRKEKSKNRPKN